ncbi:cadherin-like protein 26 [Syngnathus typhle]|uniref:cadherin-like protein 26 n=1 Tax=Syngnathus typhle TaxID=161592 RepID=UPI002A6A53CE|nr:cadherin-like protein 26 [Syngnathus typhle]
METFNLSILLMLCLGRNCDTANISQRQKRNWIIHSFTIDEGYEGPFPYSLGKVKVDRKSVLFRIHGEGVDMEPRDIIEIDENTGEITGHGPVDFERFKSFKPIFQAINRINNLVYTQLGIHIQIIDANDHSPEFEHEMYEITVKESTSQGTQLIAVQAEDADTDQNKKFDLRILSVTPRPHDLEFYLQTPDAQTGTISFKGCLDYEKAKKYTILVEAKDHGKPIQLSSSCTVIVNIEDENNHLPVITGHTGSGKVKEGLKNVLILRLQVTDRDRRGTAAWRVNYRLHGEANKSFRITTDSKTNEGLLYVEKPLDYETSSLQTLTITAHNEIPFFSCAVVRRSTTSLWTLKTQRGAMTSGQSTYGANVIVEDVNEPPIFDEPHKQVAIGENVAAGQYLEKFPARDPDFKKANSFVYMKGEDPADWVTVDPLTGAITTSKILDRESLYVKDNIYKATVCAVDDGVPPMTGTATLNIIISDDNDNAPTLAENHIDMCQSDGPAQASITALDHDEDPHGGPFHFRLHGDITGRWMIDPNKGFSVHLMKENIVPSGLYVLLLEVSDLQGNAALHNLSVTVCTCLLKGKPNCRLGKASSPTVGKTVGIISSCLVPLTGIPLTAFLRSRKKKREKRDTSEGLDIPDSSGHLMRSNAENLGHDCEVPLEPFTEEERNREPLKAISPIARQQNWVGQKPSRPLLTDVSYFVDEMLNSLQTKEDLVDDVPRVYAEEGDLDKTSDLDAISVPEIPFEPDWDLDFTIRSPTSLQMPDTSTTYNITTSHEMHNLQNNTVFPVVGNILKIGKNKKYRRNALYL